MVQPEQPEDKSSIEKLQTNLYSRDTKALPVERDRRHLHAHQVEAKHDWEMPKTEVKKVLEPSVRRALRQFSYTQWLLIGAGMFFLMASLVASYRLLGNRNVVSPENVAMVVTGPFFVDAGEEMLLHVAVTNNNPAPLEETEIIVDFPPGTHNPQNPANTMGRIRQPLGTIQPGESKQYIIRGLLFGKANDKKEVAMTLEYSLAGSNTIFTREKTYEVTLGASPIEVVVRSVKEITAGEEMLITVDVISNSSETINNVLLIADYPFAFTLTGTSPQPSFGKNVWNIGNLRPESKQTIELRGTLEGEDTDERVLRFLVGIRDDKNEKEIKTPLVSALQAISVRKPFIGLRLRVNNNRGPLYTVSAGRGIGVVINWVNNLPVPIVDTEIRAKITGPAFNEKTVRVSKGFYRSLDDTVVWTSQDNPSLNSLAPGGASTVDFSFTSFDLASGNIATLRNPVITLDVSVVGRRINGQGVSETITSTVVGDLRLIPDMRLASQLTHSSGPFINNGPVPPKADVETTYTVTWRLTNTTSDVRNVRYSAVLPPYVRWLGQTSPQSERLLYTAVGDVVTWIVGDVPAGTGIATIPREVSFQIGVTPSITHIGGEPEVVSEGDLVGEDTFTKTSLDTIVQALGTRLVNDPKYSPQDSGVVTP